MSMRLTETDDGDGDPDGKERRPARTVRLDRRLRDCGRTVATRELRVALADLEGLTPAQRHTVARMASRIASDVLAPAREAADAGDAEERTVARLFDPERIRDGR